MTAPAHAIHPVPAPDPAAPVLLAIDGRVPEPEAIVAALTAPAEVVTIDPGADGLDQLLAAVRAAPGRRLVIVCHGWPGTLTFGDRLVTAALAGQRRPTLAAIGARLAGRPVSVYACRAAEGEAGRALVAALEAATGCPVAAATGPVGAAAEGGTWTLDAGGADPSLPPVLDPARLAGWRHLLDAQFLVT